MDELRFYTWTPKDGAHSYPRKGIRGILDEATARSVARTEASIRRVDMQMWSKGLDYRSKWEKWGGIGVPIERDTV